MMNYYGDRAGKPGIILLMGLVLFIVFNLLYFSVSQKILSHKSTKIDPVRQMEELYFGEGRLISAVTE